MKARVLNKPFSVSVQEPQPVWRLSMTCRGADMFALNRSSVLALTAISRFSWKTAREQPFTNIITISERGHKQHQK
ncbi:hypothetical protein KCP70_17815 [Salmonella enterica subsp. enterica]|nr:hypothetical protein KCP70_17815 [Salmonella enterica subsp. enterica]